MVGAGVPLPQSRDRLHDETVRVGERLRGLERAPQRTAHDVVHRLRGQPRGEPLRLVEAARRELRVDGLAAGFLRADANRFGVPHQDQIHLAVPSSGKPRTAASSASAASGSSTLIVVIPMVRAGLRFTPRSSRNTASTGKTSKPLAHQLVDARIRLPQSFDRRLDDHVELAEVPERVRRVVTVGTGGCPVVRERPDLEPLRPDGRDRVQHHRPRLESLADAPHQLLRVEPRRPPPRIRSRR